MDKVIVQNKPGVRQLRGMYYPVVNVWRDGRLIASETMPDPQPSHHQAWKAAKAYCDRVDAIVRAALTPVTIVKQDDISLTSDNPIQAES